MAKAVPSRVFEDYDPPSDLVSEEACDTLLIYLPGFKKEQLRVQLTTSRMLKVSGERPIGANKYRRFLKEFRVPSNCDTREISAKFEGGILYVKQPKVITPAPKTADQPDNGKTVSEAPRPHQQAPPQPTLPRPEATPLSQPRPHQAPSSGQHHSPLPHRETPPAAQPLPQQVPSPVHHKPQPQIPEKEATTKGLEEAKAEKKEEVGAMIQRGKDKIASKIEEAKDQCGLMQRPRQMLGGRSGSGFFTELRKPDNLKRLGVSVLMVLIISFYISYMFKSFMGDEHQSLMDYNGEL